MSFLLAESLSLLLALVFYDILGNNTNVIVIGICGELAKVIAVSYFVLNLKYRYILNGLLLGAANRNCVLLLLKPLAMLYGHFFPAAFTCFILQYFSAVLLLLEDM